METSTTTDASLVVTSILLRGNVQGLGVRPTVVRLANNIGLSGFVRNSNAGVEIEIVGNGHQVQQFRQDIAEALPYATLLVTKPKPIVAAPIGSRAGPRRFVIETSQFESMMATIVPTDRRICSECLREVKDPSNRRYRDPFATCTTCGPRYTLIRSMPYDRKRTSMGAFTMCPDCQQEYESPNDRRFHSQTNSCPKCGPQVWLRNSKGEKIASGFAAIDLACDALNKGLVVGIRGVGGYQWMVDAGRADAVSRLRTLKQRPEKPLAVMVADERAARAIAVLDPIHSEVLGWFANPIVICKRRDTALVDASVYGQRSTIGLMLPTTPLHQWLADVVARPLVVTSGNLEDDPIVFDANDDWAGHTRTQADMTIEHDREIVHPIDDSVVQVIGGKCASLRLGRGLAPLSLDIPQRFSKLSDCVLAVGGHQKSAVALFNGKQAVLGPHVGDMDLETTRRRYQSQIDWISDLYQASPALVVHDLHPQYHTTQWAQSQPAPTLAVQHHHAHILSAMWQEKWLEKTVLGIAWDGTGYGPDGTIWGGEFLIASIDGFQRVASLVPFPLIGGEVAIKQPWRVAVALVYQALGRRAASGLKWKAVPSIEIARLVDLLDRPSLPSSSIQTSSMGRLFDGIAALTLGISQCRQEGEPAVLLEQACQPNLIGCYPFAWIEQSPRKLDWRPMLKAILRDLAVGAPAAAIAIRFHRALASAILDVCNLYPELPTVISGGCFQNQTLVELIAQATMTRLSPLAMPGIIPVGDGGLAAGQLAIGIRHLELSKGNIQPCV
jgi:hydrogenase maturation protein HypF